MKEWVDKNFEGTKYVSHSVDQDVLTIILESTQETNSCPYCSGISKRVHSYNERKFSDLPLDGFKVNVRLYNKKFFCTNKACSYTTFSEVFNFINPLEVKTKRLINQILMVYENNSSRQAALLLKELGVKTCKATVCNLKNKQFN